MRRFNPGNKAGLLFILALFAICLIGAEAMAMDKEVAENPLRDHQGLGKTAAIDEVVCEIGNVSNLITNSTSEKATGTNDWTIIVGDDSAELPSMIWKTPSQYASNNHYLYFASMRVAYNGHNIRLSNDQATNITVLEGGTDPNSISLFDTEFYIDDQSALVPAQYKVGVGVRQKTYAWSESYRDDFIIYDWWIYNLNETGILEDVYIGVHADADISTAEGGTGTQAWSRDDLPGYYRDDVNKEYISYMFDGDNPTVPGNDIGGRLSPKESAGYIGSRLIYASANADGVETVQTGHAWWDWNSDPSDDDAQAEWAALISDGIWMDPPPSPHDFRYLQKFGPFDIEYGDSIRIMVAFGIGEGFDGLKANLAWGDSLFNNNWIGPSAPTAPSFSVEPGNQEVTITWDNLAESSLDPATGDADFEGYRLYRETATGWALLMECDIVDDQGFNTGLVHSYVDYDVQNYFQYTYVVTSYDKGDPANGIESLESGRGSGVSAEPGTFDLTANAEETEIHVVPNPFVAQSAPNFGFSPTQDNPSTERIVFVNLPDQSTIRIYTLTGDLITTIRNEGSDDIYAKTASWDLITDNMQTIVTGLYLYVVEAPGEDDFIGKFAVIR